jgi:2-oxoglutarate dehydrogenase complex dehydrogenase (E1) component-like enzyme
MVFNTTDTEKFTEMQQLLDNKYCKKVDFEIYSFTNKDQQSNVYELMRQYVTKLNKVKFSSMPEYEPDAPFWQPDFW